MTLITPIEKMQDLKARALISIECKQCHNPFFRTKNQVKRVLNGCPHIRFNFCSRKCAGIHKSILGTVSCICKQCKTQFTKKLGQAKKTNNHYCSHACAATYQNAHKTHGYRRSKLEIWLETELIKLYPNLKFQFNKNDTINAELDIYIPSLKLAFELNGIFHYEPIYGKEKLDKIQNNDNRKFQACLEHGIELCIINISSLKNFSIKHGQKYSMIIINLINTKINGATEEA